MANAYVSSHHRHCGPVVGHKFSLGCFWNESLVGVAICGRPVARHLDNGSTIEVNRLCSLSPKEDGKRNVCSKLYGACCQYAQCYGYSQIITYTLVSERGTTLKAAGFALEAEKVGGTRWSGRRKHRSTELKNRWSRLIH
ncbi:hypothetical protein P0M28_30565 (plasmid) [Tunicatimonas pelagia]|nr:XF1762 family protein [Tunicatimonas pelagia]WKN46496.1 hypothetical protein P0M28_30565 [Tunicatimonas pelagia]